MIMDTKYVLCMIFPHSYDCNKIFVKFQFFVELLASNTANGISSVRLVYDHGGEEVGKYREVLCQERLVFGKKF